VPREVEIANDLGAKQGDDIRADGKLKSGKYFFCDCGTAQHVPALENEHFLSRTGEISRMGEAVVPSADHDCVVYSHFLVLWGES
jgi:hypothetical protein